MGTVRDYEGLFGLSYKRQTAYGTALASTDITVAMRTSAYPDVDFTPEVADDADKFGKGHEWPTEQAIERKNLALKLDFDLTSHSAGFLFAFLMQNVVSTKQDESDAYQHIITPKSIATSKSLYVTTMIQLLSSGFEKQLRDMACNEVSLSGGKKERAKISSSWIGSGNYEDSSIAAMPNLISSPYLKSDNLLFKLGTKGSETDRSLDLTNIDMSFSNDMLADEGYCFNGNGERREAEIGKRKLTFKFGLRAAHDSDAEFDRLFAQTPLSAIIDFVSPVMVDDTYPHSCKIEIPNFVYKATPIKVDGKVVGYDIDTTPMYDEMLLGAIKVTVVNDVIEYLALPT